MKLEDYTEALSYDTAFWMAGVLDPEYPFENLGDVSLETSDKLRAMAIIVLITEAKTDAFYHNLIRSGRSREIYLRRCLAEGQTEDHHRASGRIAPLLDAIVAADSSLSRRLTELSRTELLDGHEYEDDFCYAQILHGLVIGDTNRVPALLERFDAYIEGKTNARYAVANALVNPDQTAFDDAFESLIVERDLEIARSKARGQLEEPHIIAQRRVFVEGLAILRLAEARGLKTEAEYRYCPSLARAPMRTPFPGE